MLCRSIAFLLCVFSFATLAEELGDKRKAELEHLLRHDCGSCHGMTLQGGLGPPLTADALATKPKPYLEFTISEGHAGTPMPPWKSVLSPNEIDYLVELLLTQTNPS